MSQDKKVNVNDLFGEVHVLSGDGKCKSDIIVIAFLKMYLYYQNGYSQDKNNPEKLNEYSISNANH